MSYVPRRQSVQIVDRTMSPVAGPHRRPRRREPGVRHHRSQILMPPPVLYSQIPFPTEYPDGFTTFTPSIATTPCPYTSITAPLSRPVKDCEGCPALAGVRNVGLDDPRARRPDSHCDFGDRRIRACPVARSVKSRSTWTGPRSQRGVSARLRGFPIPTGPRSRPVRSRRLGRPATSRGRR
jgi:hypothetical protein